MGQRIRNGYIEIRIKDHPFKNKDGYVLLHRYIYEQFYNCILLPYVHLHHIDYNKLNNSIFNLRPMYSGDHSRLHKTKNMVNRICSLCGSNNTWIRKDNNRPCWKSYKNKLVCVKCYNSIQRKLKKTINILCSNL